MTTHERDFSDPEFDEGFARGYTSWPLPRTVSERYKAGWKYGEELRWGTPPGALRIAWRSARYRRWVRGCVLTLVVVLLLTFIGLPLL